MIKTFFIKFFFLLTLLVPLSSLYANERKTFIVGIPNHLKLPLYSSYDDIFRGKYRLILDKFAEENNYNFQYVLYKNNELYYQFYNKKIDFIFPDNPVWRSPEKIRYQVYYSDFIYHFIEGIFVKKELQNQNLNNFKTLGLIEDGLIGAVEKMVENNNLKLIKAHSCAELIVMLKNNTIDSILCNYDVMQYLLQGSHAEKEIVFAPNLPFLDDYYYLSTHKYPDVIKKFNSWLAKNRTYIQQILHEQFKF